MKKIGQSSNSGIVVEHWIHHPKVNGLSPATVASMERENGKKLKLFNVVFMTFLPNSLPMLATVVRLVPLTSE